MVSGVVSCLVFLICCSSGVEVSLEGRSQLYCLVDSLRVLMCQLPLYLHVSVSSHGTVVSGVVAGQMVTDS